VFWPPQTGVRASKTRKSSIKLASVEDLSLAPQPPTLEDLVSSDISLAQMVSIQFKLRRLGRGMYMCFVVAKGV
jgi:hypothetical protein